MQVYKLYYRLGGRTRTSLVWGEFHMRSSMTRIHHEHKVSCLRVVGEEKEARTA